MEEEEAAPVAEEEKEEEEDTLCEVCKYILFVYRLY